MEKNLKISFDKILFVPYACNQILKNRITFSADCCLLNTIIQFDDFLDHFYLLMIGYG